MLINRSREDILASMLEVTLSAEKQTIIMYRANLSFSQLKSYLQLMLRLGFIARTPERLWLTTGRGREYLDAYYRVKQLLSLDEGSGIWPELTVTG